MRSLKRKFRLNYSRVWEMRARWLNFLEQSQHCTKWALDFKKTRLQLCMRRTMQYAKTDFNFRIPKCNATVFNKKRREKMFFYCFVREDTHLSERGNEKKINKNFLFFFVVVENSCGEGAFVFLCQRHGIVSVCACARSLTSGTPPRPCRRTPSAPAWS